MALDAALQAAASDAAAKWPGIHVDAAFFVAYLRERLAPEQAVSDVASLHAADLYLACACVQGNDAAWRELDRAYLSKVAEYICRIDTSPAFVDEVRQQLAERLMPADAEVARLSRYSGRGPLGAWLRIAAIRVARDIKRTVRVTDDIADHSIPGDGKDIEMAFLKRQFASVFSEAFQAVLATLTTDERNVLRLHYLDGLTIEQVGRTYGVSRATAARWLQSARATIVERIRAALSDRVDPGSAGPSSVLAFVQSQLDMSLRRHLA